MWNRGPSGPLINYLFIGPIGPLAQWVRIPCIVLAFSSVILSHLKVTLKYTVRPAPLRGAYAKNLISLCSLGAVPPDPPLHLRGEAPWCGRGVKLHCHGKGPGPFGPDLLYTPLGLGGPPARAIATHTRLFWQEGGSGGRIPPDKDWCLLK